LDIGGDRLARGLIDHAVRLAIEKPELGQFPLQAQYDLRAERSFVDAVACAVRALLDEYAAVDDAKQRDLPPAAQKAHIRTYASILGSGCGAELDIRQHRVGRYGRSFRQGCR